LPPASSWNPGHSWREDANTSVALLLDVGLVMMIGKGLLMAVLMDVTVVRGLLVRPR